MLSAGLIYKNNHPSVRDDHFQIIISDPVQFPSKLIAVNVTSWSPDADQSCILENVDHECITKRSIIFYAKARIIEGEAKELLINYLADGKIYEIGITSPPLLERIRRGAEISNDTPFEIIDLLQEQGLLD